MSKKKKKDKTRRGPTFVGLAPIYEKTRDQRIEAKWKKHKSQQINLDE